MKKAQREQERREEGYREFERVLGGLAGECMCGVAERNGVVQGLRRGYEDGRLDVICIRTLLIECRIPRYTDY